MSQRGWVYRDRERSKAARSAGRHRGQLEAARHDLAVQAPTTLRILVRSLDVALVFLLALAVVARAELYELREFGDGELEDLLATKAEALAAASSAFGCAALSVSREREHSEEVRGGDAGVGDGRGQKVALAEGEVGDHVQVFFGFAVGTGSCDEVDALDMATQYI